VIVLLTSSPLLFMNFPGYFNSEFVLSVVQKPFSHLFMSPFGDKSSCHSVLIFLTCPSSLRNEFGRVRLRSLSTIQLKAMFTRQRTNFRPDEKNLTGNFLHTRAFNIFALVLVPEAGVCSFLSVSSVTNSTPPCVTLFHVSLSFLHLRNQKPHIRAGFMLMLL